MWAVFLLSAMSVAVAALVIVYIANKILIAMKRDNAKYESEMLNKTNEDKENSN